MSLQVEQQYYLGASLSFNKINLRSSHFERLELITPVKSDSNRSFWLLSSGGRKGELVLFKFEEAQSGTSGSVEIPDYALSAFFQKFSSPFSF